MPGKHSNGITAQLAAKLINTGTRLSGELFLVLIASGLLGLLCQLEAEGCFASLEGPRWQARQAEISTGEEAQVDGVAVYANVLQGPANVAGVLSVTERVFMHGLDVIVPGKETGGRREPQRAKQGVAGTEDSNHI